MRRIAIPTVLALCVFPAFAGDERFPVPMPEGFKVGHQQTAGAQTILEMVPETESVLDWTRMVTMFMVKGGQASAMRQIADGMSAGWLKACPGATIDTIEESEGNGYPTLMFALHCPKLASTGKPEHTWVRMIGGKDSLYMLQSAFRFTPSEDDKMKARSLLEATNVCDLADRSHPCPEHMRTQ